MKEKIITFILITVIIGVIGVIGILGYAVYTEINEDGSLQITFESETGFPSIQYVPSNSGVLDFLKDEDLFGGVEGNSTVSGNTTEKKQSRHLYEQLSSTAKTIYRALYASKDNLKTGRYRVEFGNEFQSLLSQEGGDELLKVHYQSAIEALVYENPDIFFLDVTKMYINIEKITKITGTKYNVYIDNGSEICYLSEGFYSKEDVERFETQLEQTKNQIISAVDGKTDYEKIKLIHNYLIDTIEYEGTLTKDHIYDIYGSLINKKCVCEGYAKSFQYLMNEIGIENTIVIGTATNSKNETENHAWNYVKLNEKWYGIDVTWDDPVIAGGGKLTNKARYEYFLKGSKTMDKNHNPSGQFTSDGKIFSYPTLSVEDYK